MGARDVRPRARQLTPWDGNRRPAFLWAGEEQTWAASAGLADEQIRARFPIAEELRQSGASYRIADETYFRAVQRTSRLVGRIVVLSDTPVTESLLKRIGSLPCKVRTTVGGPSEVAHVIMRLSTILIGSNSQLSFAAGVLRGQDQLTLYPLQHDVDPDSSSNHYLRAIA